MRVYCGLLLSYSRRFKILRTAYLSSLASNDQENLDNDFSTLTSIHLDCTEEILMATPVAG